MTFTFYKTALAAHRGGCPLHCGTFLDFLARCADQGINVLAPFSGRAAAASRKPSASYILHKDPDGVWFIDQCKPDTAAAIRPISASSPAGDGYRAPACGSADPLFIIEIG